MATVLRLFLIPGSMLPPDTSALISHKAFVHLRQGKRVRQPVLREHAESSSEVEKQGILVYKLKLYHKFYKNVKLEHRDSASI